MLNGKRRRDPGSTDLTGRVSSCFIAGAIASIERLAAEHGAANYDEASRVLLDSHAQHVIAIELERCLDRAMVDRQIAPTPIVLSDVLDVAELAVRILVLLPLKTRRSCAHVCRAWAAHVRNGCEDETRHESKTVQCTRLHHMDSPIIQLGLFTRASKSFVLALSRRCELRKFLCDGSGAAVTQVEWRVPAVQPDSLWTHVWRQQAGPRGAARAPADRAASDDASEGGAGASASSLAVGSSHERSTSALGWRCGHLEQGVGGGSAAAGAPLPPSCAEAEPVVVGGCARARRPFDPQVVVNNAGSYLMLLQHGVVRLFHALFHHEWAPDEVALNFQLPARVTALQFFPLDNNVFAVAHAELDPTAPAGATDATVQTIQVLTVRGATIQKLVGLHAEPIESLCYYKDAKGSLTFQVSQSADVVHWWRVLHNPQWPGMVHSQPLRSLWLRDDAAPAAREPPPPLVAVRVHPNGEAVVVVSTRELRVRSYCTNVVPNARRALRTISSAALLVQLGTAIVLVSGSMASERADQILFFSCAGLRLLRKCCLKGLGLHSRITAIVPPEAPETRTTKKCPNSTHELAIGNERGEVFLLRYA